MGRQRTETIRRILEMEEAVHRTLGWGDAPAWQRLELGYGQLKILLLIQADGPRTVGGIAAALSLSKATVSETLDRLEAGGWVVRSVDPKDRRRVLVALTENGHRLAEDLVQGGRRRTERLLSHMDDIELDQVRLGLEAMERAARRLVREEGESDEAHGEGRNGE